MVAFRSETAADGTPGRATEVAGVPDAKAIPRPDDIVAFEFKNPLDCLLQPPIVLDDEDGVAQATWFPQSAGVAATG